jgi:hypothetical protein
MSAVKINSEILPEVRPELWNAERVLWADRSAKIVLSWMEKYLFGFSIFWLIVVALLFLPQLTSGQETYEITINGVPTEVSFTSFLLFASIFPLFGLVMLASVFVAANLRTKQIYAVTDKRSILISTFLMRRVTSIPHGNLIKVRRFGKNDVGSIEFHEKKPAWFSFEPNRIFEMSIFSGISNPKVVEELIMSLQKEEK